MVAETPPAAANPQMASFLALVRERTESARRDEILGKGELAKLEAATRRRARAAAFNPLSAEVTAMVGAARIDVDVPTESRIPAARGVKQLIKKGTGWYLNYLAQQVSAMGHAFVRLGRAVSGEIERLDADVADLQEQIDALKARMEHEDAAS